MLELGLAPMGIYGVVARTMGQRMGEFAVRLALGASGKDITQMVLGSGVKLAVVNRRGFRMTAPCQVMPSKPHIELPASVRSVFPQNPRLVAEVGGLETTTVSDC
jgi:hypothetical protein